MIQVPPLITPVAKPLTMPRKHPVLLDPSCVVYYDFSRGPKLQDFSGKGNHGTINGATFTAKGKYEPSLDFDGLDDYVACGNNKSLDLTTFTLEVLFLLRENKNHNGLISKGNDPNENYEILTNADGNIATGIRWTDGTRTTQNITLNLSINTWYHLTMTYISTLGLKIYIEGELKDTALNFNKTPATNTINLLIGNESNTSRYINGQIGMVRIYNRALTANEIKRIYEAEK